MSKATLRQSTALRLIEVTVDAIRPMKMRKPTRDALELVDQARKACAARVQPEARWSDCMKRQHAGVFRKISGIFAKSWPNPEDQEAMLAWLRGIDRLVCEVLKQTPEDRVEAWDKLDRAMVKLFRSLAANQMEGWARGQEIGLELVATAFNDWKMVA